MAKAIKPTALPAVPLGIKGDSGSLSTSPSASTAKGGTFSTGSFIAGILTGLAIGVGLLSLVQGKGKRRSNGSRSAQPELYDESTPVPPPFPAVDARDCVTEVEKPTPAPAGAAKRKLTDEDVALIRAWYDGGVPAKEIAARLGISVKTVYARRNKRFNNQHETNDDRQ